MAKARMTKDRTGLYISQKPFVDGCKLGALRGYIWLIADVANLPIQEPKRIWVGELA
jgi:hypothetical protein